jgi:hypothetical protein
VSVVALRQEAIERTETALVLPDGLPETAWRSVGEELGCANRASAWWIGDWITYGEEAGYISRETYDAAESLTGLSRNYLRQCAMISRKFESLDRSNDLTWTHHFKAAALENPGAWLRRAADEGWTVSELIERSRQAPARAVFPRRRHSAVIDAASELVKTARPGGNTKRWVREMTDELSPPEARKQLTVLKNAMAVLEEVIEAVEYRSATPYQFMGR